jgi:hypothetical protein
MKPTRNNINKVQASLTLRGFKTVSAARQANHLFADIPFTAAKSLTTATPGDKVLIVQFKLNVHTKKAIMTAE